MPVLSSPHFDNHEQVVFAADPQSGLKAIIAVHNTALGPAIGGCRAWHYADEDGAIADVLRLSRGMTYKAAMADVPFGGGKSVLMLGRDQQKTAKLLDALGRAIEGLGGRYIAGEDIGTTAADMAQIRQSTLHVMGMPREQGGSGDPSPMTALGCFVSIQQAVKHKLRTDSLSGIRVAVQGLGNVGSNLCRLLHGAGARLTVTDVIFDHVRLISERCGAQAVEPEAIFGAEVDVFAPCALGAVINARTAGRLKASIVAGGANNQLARPQDGYALHERGILYAPDYVVNAGGMIQLAAERLGEAQDVVEARVRGIAKRLGEVFLQSERENKPPHIVADQLAETRFRPGALAA